MVPPQRVAHGLAPQPLLSASRMEEVSLQSWTSEACVHTDVWPPRFLGLRGARPSPLCPPSLCPVLVTPEPGVVFCGGQPSGTCETAGPTWGEAAPPIFMSVSLIQPVPRIQQ